MQILDALQAVFNVNKIAGALITAYEASLFKDFFVYATMAYFSL